MTAACSAAQPKAPGGPERFQAPKTVSVEKAHGLVEKAFIESCMITFTVMTRQAVVPDEFIQACEQIFIRYQMGQIGVQYVPAKRPPERSPTI